MNEQTMKTESRTTGVSNVISNIWLTILALIVGATVIVTSVLVGWPIISYLAARFMA